MSHEIESKKTFATSSVPFLLLVTKVEQNHWGVAKHSQLDGHIPTSERRLPPKPPIAEFHRFALRFYLDSFLFRHLVVFAQSLIIEALRKEQQSITTAPHACCRKKEKTGIWGERPTPC